MQQAKRSLTTKKTFRVCSQMLLVSLLFFSTGCAVVMRDKSQSQTHPDVRDIQLKTYYMNQKMWTIGDRFIIRNESGDPQFYIKEKLFSIGDKLKIYAMDGEELAYIKQKLFSFRKQYRIYHDQQLLARIIKKITLFKDKFIVDVPGPNDYTVKGNFTDHNYTFKRNGKIVAFISKQWFTWSDNYKIEIVPGEYDVLILATAVVIDMIKANEENNQHHHS